MERLTGAVLEADGTIIFRFTTGFCATYDGAVSQAKEICMAWREFKDDPTITFAIDGVPEED